MINLKPLSKKRLLHCRSVGAYSYDLAMHWQVDPMKAYLSGVLHDIARELPREELLDLAICYGVAVSDLEREHPILLHGAVSAIIARENYGIDDAEISSSMAKHTVGHANMSKLDKIIYLADEIEPLRVFPGVEGLRKLVYNDLDQCLLTAIEQSLQYSQNRGIAPHPQTLAMRENLLKEKNKV